MSADDQIIEALAKKFDMPQHDVKEMCRVHAGLTLKPIKEFLLVCCDSAGAEESAEARQKIEALLTADHTGYQEIKFAKKYPGMRADALALRVGVLPGDFVNTLSVPAELVGAVMGNFDAMLRTIAGTFSAMVAQLGLGPFLTAKFGGDALVINHATRSFGIGPSATAPGNKRLGAVMFYTRKGHVVDPATGKRAELTESEPEPILVEPTQDADAATKD